MFGFSKYIYIGLGVVILGLFGTTYFLYSQNQGLNKTIATQQASIIQMQKVNEELNTTIVSLNDQRISDQQNILKLGNQINTFTAERDEAVTRLNNMRTRLSDLAQKKPTLVGRHATRATSSIMWDVACAGGNKDKNRCPREVSPSSSSTDSSPTEDKSRGLNAKDN